MGDIYADAPVLQLASEAVELLLQEDPELEKPENAALQKHLSAAAANSVDFRSI